MSEHRAQLNWQRKAHPEDNSTFCRNHTLVLNGEQTINASSAAGFMGDAQCSDPEQMLVAAVSSCHMLTFLAIADIKGFKVERYQDDAVGFLTKAERGKVVSRIELHPSITFGGDKQPTEAELDRLHDGAHKNCFIANSIKAEVEVIK
ncbi:OsmC family protein [Oceanospirillum linum]|uniref:Osmotically inducible protein OsmC n=1 Tax=Oceanospirillum linum TaxID=966 RepID=A0A1T1HAU8_OCELI|nr:OsmC family protein [Oceanospirillum linum]OOV86984.1 osmotically inducible protein OsmC [Oceanospirillum linum]SEF70609.1 Organic hydroperoxide reductase OsmC/OhrA [Oleiphilus messinensis]SMP15390.1 Organic hydroperoxide reductase OsmC/OhrA [Oceanospirillum linum]